MKNRRFTGRITNHLDNDGKLGRLKEFCLKYNPGLEHCVAIGDSESDLDIFRKCRYSIAINSSEAVKEEASGYIITDDLFDLISILEIWLAP